ncbi:MAG: 8-oxo-dGTP diphosphatase MutT [Kangiellaceae bacterium]|nr:8-oxo-dGTP diphosphatase MutT [Kangiellaceae bacterium]MCW8998587.1 8-oxo-dGTP diphosphatase MutT [Kangiellaceae bacterium]MCW9016129.1 8-oxo-dGTP diphosphatase MutT [Kangiellaceae bacterium]
MSHIQVAAAIILQDDKVLIAQRPADKHKGGYWEFPGGKIDPPESPVEALRREIFEELNIHIKSADPFTEINFEYPEKKVSLKFFVVENFSGTPQGMEGQPIKWVPRLELVDYRFPEANQPVVDKLLKE